MKNMNRVVLLLCACLAAAALPVQAELKTGDQMFQAFVGGDKVVGQQRYNYDVGVLTGADYFVNLMPAVAFGVEGRFEDPGQKTIGLHASPPTTNPAPLPQQELRFRTGGAAALLRFNFTPKSVGTPYVLMGYSGNYTNAETLITNQQANTTSATTIHYWRGGGIGAVGYDYFDETGWTAGLEARFETYDKANDTVDLLIRLGWKF